MNKIAKVDNFSLELSKIRISHKRCNEYHIQVMNVHNFYPSTNVYYNSSTGIKEKFKNNITENHNSFMEFLQNQNK